MFVGGALHAERSWSYLDTKFHFVPHDSIDFTAMIYIVENPTVFKHVEQWLYLHDTVRLLGGFPFWRVLTHRWCNWNQTCAVPLSCSSMSSNMGLCAARYLWKVQETILTLKNPELTGHARHKWKERNIGWEDLVFRLCAVAAQWHVGNLATDMSTKAQLRTRAAVLTSTDPGFRLRTCEGSRARLLLPYNHCLCYDCRFGSATISSPGEPARRPLLVGCLGIVKLKATWVSSKVRHPGIHQGAKVPAASRQHLVIPGGAPWAVLQSPSSQPPPPSQSPLTLELVVSVCDPLITSLSAEANRSWRNLHLHAVVGFIQQDLGARVSRIVVYNKCLAKPGLLEQQHVQNKLRKLGDGVISVLPLPNVGRCDHTYVSHIVMNYNMLSPATVFIKDSSLLSRSKPNSGAWKRYLRNMLHGLLENGARHNSHRNFVCGSRVRETYGYAREKNSLGFSLDSYTQKKHALYADRHPFVASGFASLQDWLVRSHVFDQPMVKALISRPCSGTKFV